MPDSQSSIPPRIILLGASNLTRGIGVAVDEARCALGPGPCEFLIACGHGRSYGIDSALFGRVLPGIVNCGLWERLDALSRIDAGDRRTVALITDVGNDIMYGCDAARIATWVEQCIERLRAAGAAQVIMTTLPMERIARINRKQYRILRAILFPKHDLPFDVAMARGHELDALLREIAARHGVALVEPLTAWYGADPIHIRTAFFGSAWRHIFGPWRGESGESTGVDSRRTLASVIRNAVGIRLSRPHSMRLFGVRLQKAQPAVKLADGSTVSLF